jgi:hypothetical protein
MVKVADTLARGGWEVRVISLTSFDWGADADRDIVRRRDGLWRWESIECRKSGEPIRYARTALGQRASMMIAGAIGAERTPLPIASRASERVYRELRDAAASEQCDLVYGGARALSATRDAALALRTPFALDLEDFHSGEVDAGNTTVNNGALIHALFARIERDVLQNAAFLTTGSDAIRDAYESAYNVRAFTINNVFTAVDEPPRTSSSEPLRLYWFSQMVTARRGIEDAVRAAGHSGIPMSLTLRGRSDEGFAVAVSNLAREVAPNLQLDIVPPVFPDDVVEAARDHDVGLALEQGFSRNNSLALSNKAFTYIAAGLAVAFTNTPGQRELAADLGSGAFIYEPADWKSLGDQLRKWSDDRGVLQHAKLSAWTRARARWNWENPAESGKVLQLAADSVES